MRAGSRENRVPLGRGRSRARATKAANAGHSSVQPAGTRRAFLGAI
jgi:hypothetical protein